MRTGCRVLWIAMIQVTLAAAATYHVDALDGNDAFDGTRPAKPWRTLDRVNAQVFQPGDRLLFKAGTCYNGQLRPQGSGKLEDGKVIPIRIGQYGDGPRPRIDGEGKVLDTLLIRNVEYWEVQDLEVTNLGEGRVPWRTGVRIVVDGFGAMRHILLRNLYVHDVNGDLRKDQEGCGIYFESRGGNSSHFEDLVIEGCHVVRADRNGICQRSSSRTRSLGVVIRDNLLEDIGGDGIKVWGSNGALVEYNVLRGGRTRCEDYAAGIWPWDSNDTVIQYNEVSGMKGIKDGQGFDSDYRCRRSVFQYNYSHDNDGGFMLICSPGNSYCEDTVIRYNLSIHDGINTARVFHFGGGAGNTRIYNNTIYIGPDQDLPLVLCTEWDRGNAHGTYFTNNIFYVAGRVTYDWGKATNTLFSNNAFFGNHSEILNDPNAITQDPCLVGPLASRPGREALDGFKLKAGSPCIGKGLEMGEAMRLDFWGGPLAPLGSPRCIGVHEFGER
jgi:hypothetical protein